MSRPEIRPRRRGRGAAAARCAFALAACMLGWAAEARATHCAWTYDPAIGQPGLSTPGSGSAARAFALWEGDLVACGDFASAGGQPVTNAARWDGTRWSAMGDGFSSTVWSLNVFRGSLYAFGQFQLAWPAIAWRAARWDGAS